MNRWTKRAVILAVGASAVAAAGFAGPQAYVKLASNNHIYTVSTVPQRPVALVLGAQIYSDGTPSLFLQGRLDVAKQLYDSGKVKAILVSGDNGQVSYNEPDGMRAYLISAGVPAKQVIADYAGFDTYDSCVRAKRVFGVERLTVISQGYHVPRAVATCRSVGIDALGVGDYSGMSAAGTWRYGQFRELLANVKMAGDLITRRTPMLGKRETSVDEALA